MGSGWCGKYDFSIEKLGQLRENNEVQYDNNSIILRNSTGNSEIDSNAKKVKTRFPYNEYGQFGEKSVNCRVIVTKKPHEDSMWFYERIGEGGQIRTIPGREGTITTLDDGTVVTHRNYTSIDGSSAVDINIKSPGKLIHTQKIHFEEKL